MTSSSERRTGAREHATASGGGELSGARLFLSDVSHARSDVRVGVLLADHAYGHLIAKVFGTPREHQTVLVKLIMTGVLATVLGDYVARLPRIHPSGVDAAIGTSVLNTALRGLAGPSKYMPAAGLLIGLALLRRGLPLGIRSAATVTAHDVQVAVHGVEARYGHHPTA